MGLEVGGGGTEEKEEEEEEKEEKIPLCESIGHRPLRGRCPAPTLNYNHDLPKQGTGTADHLTLLRLLLFSDNIINGWRKHFSFVSLITCWYLSLEAGIGVSRLELGP